MRPVTVTVEIGRPADEVFDFVSNFENNPGWQRGMRSCRWTSEPPIRVGSTYDQVAHFLRKDVVSSFRVVELDPGRRVKITSTSGPFPITETRIMEPLGAPRCRMTAVVEGEAGGFFRVAGPLLRLMVRRSVGRDYACLASTMETA